MIIAVDTNVLIDILNKDEEYFESSTRLLNKALKHYRTYFTDLSLFPHFKK
ncbi:hypothetical protein J7M02_05785 [Candidatus Aerophobetes bacterium]|nr:hypothetical protein [Candidatus Aerophobetes bacterium]